MISPSWGFRHGGGSDGARADCSRASGGAPACGQPGCRDRPEAEPRPCGSPRPPRSQPGRLRDRHQQRLVRDRGLRSPTPGGHARRAGRRSWRRTRSGPPQAAQTRRTVGQTRAGRGGGTHRRDLRRPKGPKVSVLASSSSTCMVNSPIRFMALSSSACTGSPSLLERGVDPADRFLTPLLEPEDLYRPTGATEVAPARHAKAAERPHACAPPSIAGQVPAGLPAKPGLGKTWTSQARPHLPQAHQQQLSSQNYRSCSGPPWTLRLSQFCVQGNRVRLNP